MKLNQTGWKTRVAGPSNFVSVWFPHQGINRTIFTSRSGEVHASAGTRRNVSITFGQSYLWNCGRLQKLVNLEAKHFSVYWPFHISSIQLSLHFPQLWKYAAFHPFLRVYCLPLSNQRASNLIALNLLRSQSHAFGTRSPLCVAVKLRLSALILVISCPDWAFAPVYEHVCKSIWLWLLDCTSKCAPWGKNSRWQQRRRRGNQCECVWFF